MDASKRVEMRAKGMQIYRSNWQPRDGSEITLRKRDMANKGASSVHQGPVLGCCVPRSTSPINGFSTNYSPTVVASKKAGCADCNDPNFGKPGGLYIQTCDPSAIQTQLGYTIIETNISTVATVFTAPANPVLGSSKYCADPGILQKPGILPCDQTYPSYSGWRNQTSYLTDGKPHTSVGTVRQIQRPAYPSG